MPLKMKASSGSRHRTRKRGHDVVYVLLMQLLTLSDGAFTVSRQDRPSVVFKAPFHQQERQRQQHKKSKISFGAAAESDTATTPIEQKTVEDCDRPLCFYRAPSNNSWHPRFELGDLEVGQQLQAMVVQDLFDGKTGPKVFCEVGVGRCRHKKSQLQGEWKIINAMLRLGPRGSKRSVAVKRVARLRNKPQGFPVFVHKVRLDNDQLEVCLDCDEALNSLQLPSRVSVSSLSAGDEVMGQVTRVEPYGVLLDVGANRHGLLHIQQVSQFFQRYIDKEEGLKQEAGLERGARVVLQVLSNNKKRLLLDFTKEAKREVEQIRKEERKKKRKIQMKKSKKQVATNQTLPSSTGQPTAATTKSIESTSSFSLSPEEEAAWTAYAASQETAESQSSSQNHEDHEKEDEEYAGDDYDEDREIEDALGLGTY